MRGSYGEWPRISVSKFKGLPVCPGCPASFIRCPACLIRDRRTCRRVARPDHRRGKGRGSQAPGRGAIIEQGRRGTAQWRVREPRRNRHRDGLPDRLRFQPDRSAKPADLRSATGCRPTPTRSSTDRFRSLQRPLASIDPNAGTCTQMRHSGTTSSNDEVVLIPTFAPDFCAAYAVSEQLAGSGDIVFRPHDPWLQTPRGKPRESTSANSRCYVPGRWKHSSAHAGDGRVGCAGPPSSHSCRARCPTVPAADQ